MDNTLKILGLINLTMDLTLLRSHEEISLEESNEIIKIRTVLSSEYFQNWLLWVLEEANGMVPDNPQELISMIKESWI